MNFHVLTLFPEMITQGVSTSITGRALKQNIISLETINIRDFADNKHNRVDDYTYGGGAGMLMQAEPVFAAYKHAVKNISEGSVKRVIYVTPQGRPFNQNMAMDFAKSDDIVFLCGHYEGIDERVLEEVVTDYVSIGDYVLTGGELAAMVMIDAIARLVPGVLHNDMSAETESFHGKLLEYPQYSRPELWHGKAVPEVLLSGNTKKINEWRIRESEKRTRERRPDLYREYQALQECKSEMMKKKLLHIDMIELINRGRAELVFAKDREYLLRDTESGVYMHTNLKEGQAEAFAQDGCMDSADVECIILHQPELMPVIEEKYGLSLQTECRNVVYTQREKLSVAGLYRADGRPDDRGVTIRLLTKDNRAAAGKLHEWPNDLEYFYERVESGNVFGAFIGETLAGVIGIHSEGSIGMLYVDENYRKMKLGMALETYMFNQAIEKGWIPYGQVIIDNDKSFKLQEKMGLYCSKESVYWMG